MGAQESNGVWVYAEHEDGELTRPTLEVLTAARKVADKLGQNVVAVIIGSKLDQLLDKLIHYGADKVLCCDNPKLVHYLSLSFTSILMRMLDMGRPNSFLFVAAEIGRDLAPRFAYRAKTGLATDNIELLVEDYYQASTKTNFKNLLIQIRPDFATRVARIHTPVCRPQVATVRPGNFAPAQKDEQRKGEIVRFDLPGNEDDLAAKMLSVKPIPKSSVDLGGAQCIVSLGLGILTDGNDNPRDPSEGYALAKKLAETISDKWGLVTTIGASRGLIYAELKELEGLITEDHQIGQTGATVSPEVYIALGVRGSVQHRVGMLRSKRVVAVNVDKDAPMLAIAHYPIVGDLYEEVPKMIREIEKG